jgi:hypothetical protein
VIGESCPATRLTFFFVFFFFFVGPVPTAVATAGSAAVAARTREPVPSLVDCRMTTVEVMGLMRRLADDSALPPALGECQSASSSL